MPGLDSKPVIDIMAGVKSLDESRPAIPVLAAIGYCYFPYRPEQKHWFCKPKLPFGVVVVFRLDGDLRGLIYFKAVASRSRLLRPFSPCRLGPPWVVSVKASSQALAVPRRARTAAILGR